MTGIRIDVARMNLLCMEGGGENFFFVKLGYIYINAAQHTFQYDPATIIVECDLIHEMTCANREDIGRPGQNAYGIGITWL